MFYANSVLLARKTTMWPHPEQLFLSGSKVNSYEIFRIASLALGLSVPMYAMADECVWKPEFRNKVKSGLIQGVLKRDYSMRSDHVITQSTPDCLEKLAAAVEDQRKAWSKVRGIFGQPCWFVQPFLANLLYIGETRAVVVGGRIAYKISTTQVPNDYGSWQVTDKPIIRPIHKHS